MPMIRVEMFEGRTVEQKRRIAARLTDALVEETGVSRGAVWVQFSDFARSDWALGGELYADRDAGTGNEVARQEAAEAEAQAAARAAEAEVVGPEDRSSAT